MARRGETRAKIFAAALARFRRRGIERTTMREIAEDAGVALGAAYYYFPSKDAIVLAYYEETQRACRERAERVFGATEDVRARLGAVFHAKLDVLARDRKLLSGLFKSIADPSGELSIFGRRARDVREDSIRLLAESVATSPEVRALGEDARRILVLGLFSLQMGTVLYFIHDRSPKQRKTRALVDGSLDLVTGLLPVAPDLAPLLAGPVAAILREAALLA